MIIDFFPEIKPQMGADNDERYTPSIVFQPLHREYRFTLDVCATGESAKCGRYFTKVQDGLAQNWEGERVWCNPPYSDIRPWVQKAWTSGAEVVVMLVPANRTEQPFWQELIEPHRDGPPAHWSLFTHFLPGRISFGHPGNPEGIGVGSPMFGCVLLIWEMGS